MKLLFTLSLVLSSSLLQAQLPSNNQLFVKTTGSLPYLEYGPGDDRLGGAKMGYLDSNILLKVVDSLADDYIVQLSRNHKAFIAKENVKPAADVIQRPYYLSGSWKVYGDSSADLVLVSLQEKLPYRSQQLLNPSRIQLDIFGATSNTNWITQLKSVREIKSVYYEQVEDDVLRAHIELRHAQHWGHSVYYDSTGNRLVLKIKRQPAVADIRKLKIAIDAGHGGDNAGAVGINRKGLEKDYALSMAKQLSTVLKKAGVKQVFMTRTKDTSLTMPERIAMLKAFNPDLLISMHLNSSSVDTVQGTSTYYRYIGFRPLSVAILNQMLSLQLKEFGNIGSFNFALNGPADFVNCLVEVAFLSNAGDEKKIVNPKFQAAVASKIHLGILEWLKSLK